MVHAWPIACQKEFEKLAKDCVAKKVKRIKTTNTIVRQLMDMNNRFVQPTAMEQELMKKYGDAILKLNHIRGQEEVSNQFSYCEICLLDHPITDFICCSNRTKNHSICKSCFNMDVEVQSNSVNCFSKNGREIICSMCIAEEIHSPYDYQILAKWCNPMIVAKYLKVRDEIIEREMQCVHQAEIEKLKNEKEDEIHKMKILLYEQDAKKKKEAEIERYSHHITNNILTLLCPSCNLGIDDFEGCFAVHHSADYKDINQVMRTVGCLKYFCGWCHEVFNGSHICHDHVKVCSRSLHAGSYYGTMSEYYTSRAVDKKAEIESYLVRNNVTGNLRQELLNKMRKRLNDVKINF